MLPREHFQLLSKTVVNYLNVNCDVGLLEAIRKGERAALASEPIRNAVRQAEDDRNIDLAVFPATEAIFLSESF